MAKSKTRIKSAAAAVDVPQSRESADVLVRFTARSPG